MSAPKPRPKRPASPEQIAANRQNARKSTGPITAEGKERSRENALKHGLTGAGIVQPPALETAYHQRAAAYRAELRPATTVEGDLVRTAALGATRLEQARNQGFAAARRRHARAWFDQRAALDAAINTLPDDPAGALRVLTSTVAGIDWLIDAWTNLHDAITDDGRYWTNDQRDRAFHLQGMRAEAFWMTAGRATARNHFALGRGDSTYLHAQSLAADRKFGKGLGWLVHRSSDITIDPPPREQARAELRALAATHLARLTALRQALAPLDAVDPCPLDDNEDRLWYRYETMARQAFHSALSRLHTTQADRRRGDQDGGPDTPSDEPPPDPNTPQPPAPNEANSSQPVMMQSDENPTDGTMNETRGSDETSPAATDPEAPPPADPEAPPAAADPEAPPAPNEAKPPQLVMMKSDVDDHRLSMDKMRAEYGARLYEATHPEPRDTGRISLHDSLGGYAPEELITILKQRLRVLAVNPGAPWERDPESVVGRPRTHIDLLGPDPKAVAAAARRLKRESRQRSG